MGWTGGEAAFVISPNGVASCLFLTVCSASMFDGGGVFSMSFGLAVVFSAGVGVSDRGLVGLRSEDLLLWKSSKSTNFAVRRPLSGDRLSNESLSLLTLGL